MLLNIILPYPLTSHIHEQNIFQTTEVVVGGCGWRKYVGYVIQFKIGIEYRDMVPRPRLVCQEPGVPGKSKRGLGSMSRYSAQIFICFIACIFHWFYSSVGSVGNFAGLLPCTVPSAIVHCNQNKGDHQTQRQVCHRTDEANRYTGWNMYQWEVFSAGAKWMESFIAYQWVISLYFSPESRLTLGMLGLGQVSLFCKFN